MLDNLTAALFLKTNDTIEENVKTGDDWFDICCDLIYRSEDIQHQISMKSYLKQFCHLTPYHSP